jgi:hypothetical protein
VDEAEAALRAGQLARAHVLTRRAGRPALVDDELRDGELGALFRPDDFHGPGHLLAEWLIPFDPERARSLLEPPDHGPGFLKLAWLDPRPRDWKGVLTPFAAAAALQWDARDAASIVAEHDRLHREGKADKVGAFVAGQAFQLWLGPFSRPASLEELAPFLDTLGRGPRRRAHRALYLYLRASGRPCPEPEEDPPPPGGDLDDFDAAETPDFPARDPVRAEALLKNPDLLDWIVGRWDPRWLRPRWTHDKPWHAGALFERLLPEVDVDLLKTVRRDWTSWAGALRALARFHPERARLELREVPDDLRVAALARVVLGESEARCFDVRLALARRVAGDNALARAALWLLLEVLPAWIDPATREAVASVPVDASWRRVMLSLHRGLRSAGT